MAEEKESLFEGACSGRVAELEIFIETGEASPEMLAHIDACPACAAVTEKVFKVQADDLEKLGRVIREARNQAQAGGSGSRAAKIADGVLRVMLIGTAAAAALMVAAMVAAAYGSLRDEEISRAARERVEILFPGILDRYCAAEPGILCHLGAEASACAVADRYELLPFPAPTKVLYQLDTWPQPHPVYGAAFVIVDGPDIVSYRYPNCPDGVRAAITVAGGRPQVRQFPEAGTAADECGAGPRIEVDRWRAAPGSRLLGSR